jgi:outer membrane lipoprotein-sorting protein
MVSIYSHLGRARPGLRRWLWVLPWLAAIVANAQDYEAQFNKWFAVQTNMQNWSAGFTQSRSLVALAQPLTSAGRVWVKPGEFRWELGQPPQTIVVRNPDELLILYPRFKRAEMYALDKIPPGPIKDAMALLDVSLPRDRASMEEHFQLLSATVTNATLQMTLQPKSVSARQFIGNIIIGFHTNDFVIADSEMRFSDGSTLRNDFTNVVFNQPMEPKLFETNIPPDYSVVEPLKQ